MAGRPPGGGAGLRVPNRVVKPGRPPQTGNRPPGQGGNRPPGGSAGGTPVWTPAPGGYPTPLPDPLPPPPLLKPVDVAVVGGIVVADFVWGWLNGGSGTRPYDPSRDPPPFVELQQPSTVRILVDGTITENSTGCTVPIPYEATRRSQVLAQAGDVTNFLLTARSVTAGFGCGDTADKPVGAVVRFTKSDASLVMTDPVMARQDSTAGERTGSLTGNWGYGEILVNGAAYVPSVGVGQEAPGRPVIVPPAVSPVLPGLVPIPTPSPLPGVEGDPAQSPEPGVTPSPSPDPLPGGGVALPLPVRPPTTGTGTVTTPTDSVIPWPGAKPVGGPGVGPAPSLEGIAQYLGRLEGKLDQIGPNTDRLDRIDFDGLEDSLEWLLRFIEWMNSGGRYELEAACDKNEDGTLQKVIYEWQPGLFDGGGLSARLDAIAAMLQQQIKWKVHTCHAQSAAVGVPVTVRFESEEVSIERGRRLVKKLGYRDLSGSSQEAHIEHWRGFSWTAGPVMVISQGLPWGRPQVWAVSEAEGRRVLAHAAAIAGVDLSAPESLIVARVIPDPRYGEVLAMRTKLTPVAVPWVTMRVGPNGWPSVPSA